MNAPADGGEENKTEWLQVGKEREVIAALAVGANLGDAAATVAQALTQLDCIEHTCLEMRSSLYRSAPVGPADQPNYVNAAAVVTTSLPPLELLDALHAMEDEFGRGRSGERWGPRALDIDIVTYADFQIVGEHLMVPHPEACHRCFVLVPLAEIAPALLIPGHGRVDELAAVCDTGEVHKITPEPGA